MKTVTTALIPTFAVNPRAAHDSQHAAGGWDTQPSYSGLVRHLGSAVPSSRLPRAREMWNILEGVQQRATKMIRALEHLT